MPTPLVTEALANSWGNPDPNNQVILRPARLSPINGVTKRIRHAWVQYALPNTTSRFHVYQTGQISPLLINLTEATSSWQLLSAACNASKVVINVYNQLGVSLPLTRTWYRWVDNKNIFLAVEVNERIPVDWAELEVFVRLYKNSYFERDEATVNDKIQVTGGIMATSSDITSLQSQAGVITSDEDYAGGLVAFVNGKRVPSISLVTAQAGDVVEFIYDTSVYKVVDFTINSLPTFFSTLDNKAKRLLHYTSAESTLFDYEDHIDFYMFHATTGRGVYVHKNARDTVRQLTHKDYAFAADYLPPYFANFLNSQGAVDTAQLRLKMFVRYSGQEHAPRMEANMTKFLMDLNDAQQVQAMVGSEATFPLWHAAGLESSAFQQLMRSRYDQFTSPLIEQAYGYYRVNSVLGQNILPVGEITGQIDLPPAFQHQATAFEYDTNGVLLGVESIDDQLIYFPDDEDCTLAEFIEGVGGRSLDERYGAGPVTLEEGVNYRFYLRVTDVESGLPVWQDVTGTTHYTVENGVAYWGLNTVVNVIERLVRSDKKFLTYEASLNLDTGQLLHQINYDKTTNQGTISSPLQIPMGELDVWLNNKPLVRGVDYILNYPTVSIITKEHLVYAESGPNYQNLRIRMTGFCDSALQLRPLEEVGYVFNGVLSANSRHDLHREKVQRIVLNGALVTLDDVNFVEDGEDVMETGLPIEGKPYEIRDMINRLNGLIASEPYTLWATTRTNAQAAEDYTALKIPQELVYPVSPIVQRYEVFSPFLAKILVDLEADYIDLDELGDPYSDADVRSLCVPYLTLLPLDPIGPGKLPDDHYVVVHPHPYTTVVSLPALKYQFFERVLRIYAEGKVVYSTQVNIA